MKNKLMKRLTISIFTLVFVLTTVFTNLTFAATNNINSNIQTKHMVTDNRVVYTYLPKTYFDNNLRNIDGIDTIKKNNTVIITNDVVSVVSNAIKNTAPKNVSLETIQSNVRVNYKNLRNQIMQASSLSDDWCIILTTNYGSSTCKTSNFPTYNKLVYIKTQYETGE